MELEKGLKQEKAKFVIRTCCQTGKILMIPRRVYEMAARQDKSVANKEFGEFYISPNFSFYETRSDFNMFCED
ncbi:MAG: hypothetical protein ACP5NZ_00405 [Nanobdellota archaeon]